MTSFNVFFFRKFKCCLFILTTTCILGKLKTFVESLANKAPASIKLYSLFFFAAFIINIIVKASKIVKFIFCFTIIFIVFLISF